MGGGEEWNRRGWSVVAASWVVHVCTLGTIYSAGIYFLPVARAFEVGRGEAAWMGSLWMCTILDLDLISTI